MKKSNGYSIPALLVAVTVLVILGSLATPLFNSYKQNMEVNEAVSYVLKFQEDVESCVYERQNITDCDLGSYGIQTPANLSDYNIIDYNVVDGTIRMTLDNENLLNDTFPLEIAFFANPKMRETVPTVSWDVYCNDYDGKGNQLYKVCGDNITEMPTELPDDWITWKEFTTPWRTIGGITYTSEWSPEADLQIQDYVQSRGFSYVQERDVVKKIKNLNSGEVVESLRKREERTISDTESRNVDVVISDWIDLNQTKNCSTWELPRDEVEKGIEYTQERNCSIEQERDYRHTVGNNQPIHTRAETQVVQFAEQRPATGTMQVWFPIDPTYSTWTNTGSGFDYSNWSPVISNQTSDFTQERSYSQTQERTVTEREQHSKNQKIRVTNTYTENQTITVTEERSVSVTNSAWSNSGSVYNCSAWSPATSTVNENQTFTQERSCAQNQNRVWTYTSGGVTLDTRTEGRAISTTETQVVSGTKPVWVATSPIYGDWVNVGNRNYVENWNPAVSNQTNDFVQSRDYEQGQERIRYNREVRPATGDIRTVSQSTETQTINGTATRTVTVTNGNWSNSSAIYSCSAWTPETSTVDEDETFTQSRICQQDQERAWTYKVGSTTIDTRIEGRTVNRNQTQVVSGTNPVWIETSPTYGDWVNVGNRNYVENWNPAVSNQTSDFVQSRDYEQGQERIRYNREVRPATGDIRTVSQTTETQTVNGTATRTVTVANGSWSNSSGIYSCSAWTPETSTVDEDKTFTQSRTCQQNQERTWTYKVGSTTIDTRIEGRTVDRNQTQVVSGTNPVWVSTTPTYTAWTDFGSRNYVGSWSPAASSQTNDFNQSRDYEQTQERTRNNREIRPATGDIRTVSTTRETQTVTRTATRSVDVTAGGWSNSSGIYSCSSWTPATSTVDEDETFTQSRTCQQDQERTWTYKVGSTTIHTRIEDRTVNRNQTQVVSGTNPVWVATDPTYSSWVNDGGRNYTGSWSPAVSAQTSSFIQSIDYSQAQERTRYNREIRPATGEIRTVSTTRETRTLTDTQTRTVSVTEGNWSNSGDLYDCRNWSPDPSTVNSGETFTQTGICNQNQTKTWTYKVGSTTIETRTENQTLTNVSDTRTATGTKESGECRFNETSNNRNYLQIYLWPTLYWNNNYYSTFAIYGPPTLSGSGTRSDPYVIPSGEKFYRGELKRRESTGSYFLNSYYEICKLN